MRYKTLFISAFRGGFQSKQVSKLQECNLPYNVNVFAVNYPSQEMDKEEWKLTTDAILEMRDYVEKDLNSIFILGVIPIKEQVNSKLLEYEMSTNCLPNEYIDINRSNKILSTFAKDNNIKFVDPLSALKKRYESGKDPYFSIDTHLNKVGHDAVYEAYKNFIEK